VALSSLYGVTVDGLVRVVTGLASAARAGRLRLALSTITAGRARVPDLPPMPSDQALSLGALSEWAPEYTQRSAQKAFATIKLSLLFGAFTFVLGIVCLRLLLGPADPDTGGLVASTEPFGASASATREAPTVERKPTRARLLPFSAAPTFLGKAVPVEAADAADGCPDAVDDLEQIARKLAITDDPAESVYRLWEHAVETAAMGWYLTDASTRTELAQGVEKVLFEASDMPSVADRLLDELIPPTGPMSEPLDLLRGAWKSGMLGAIAGDTVHPAFTRQGALTRLVVVLGHNLPAEDQSFRNTSLSWLEGAISKLVDRLSIGAHSVDAWELWLAAQREVRGRSPRSGLLLVALRTLLETSGDLSRPGSMQNVFGRLLSLLDYESDPEVRAAVLAWLLAIDSVSAQDLWVVTSLLATFDWAPWFTEEMVVPADADELYRRRMHDRIARRWPAGASVEPSPVEDGQILHVDQQAWSRWLEVWERLDKKGVERAPEPLMVQLLSLSVLNEAAAALASHQTAEADRKLDELQPRALWALLESPGGQSRLRVGQATSADGIWREQYLAAKRNLNERLEWLRTMRTQAGTDLGPSDGQLLVKEAYRGSPAEVRSMAQALVTERFASGMTVVMELLDQLPDAPRIESTSDLIRRVTGYSLPPARSESWASEVRLALVQHALLLRKGGADTIDRLSRAVIASYLSRVTLIRGDDRQAAATSPDEAGQQLAQAWDQVLAKSMDGKVVAAELGLIRQRDAVRLQLATGPIQDFVAAQLSVLDRLALQVRIEQPDRVGVLEEQVGDRARERRSVEDVLQQAVMVELAIAELWRMRLDQSVMQQASHASKEGMP